MGKPVILCVDDESIILDSLEVQLRNEYRDQYLYETAENVEEAMEVIDELQGDDIPLIVIVSDWLMPGTKGDEFLIEAHKVHPGVIKIMLTGQADKDAIDRAMKFAGLHRCIQKPWNKDDLIEAINSGLAKT